MKACKKYQYARTNEYLPKPTQQEITKGTVRDKDSYYPNKLQKQTSKKPKRSR